MVNVTAVITALDLLLSFVDRAQQVGELLNRAQLEGRDVTMAELDELVKEDDIAKRALEEAIAKHKSYE